MEQQINNTLQETVSEINETSQGQEEKAGVSHEHPEQTSQRTPKKKRYSKTKLKQRSVSRVLEGLEEDVLEVGQPVSVEVDITQNTVLENRMSERLFVQNKKGFEPATRDRVFQEPFHDLSGTNEMENRKQELVLYDFAIYFYQKTRLFFSFCHGILGGFGAAHISLVCCIDDNPEAIRNFAEGYPDFARAVQIVYYILSAICFVSVLDRCDFAGLQLVYCCDFVRHRFSDILTIIFYFGLLVVTVICIRWDDRFALSKHNDELWKDPEVSLSEFTQWKIFSLARGFFAVAGYITMFFGPGDDLFFVHLYNMINYKDKESDSENNRY